MVDKKHERKKILEAVTKKDILEAVVKILTQDGIQGLTMGRIATEARVAKGTLYLYFKDKQEIIEAAIEESLAPLVDELSMLLKSDLSPKVKIEQFSLSHLSYFDAHKELFRVLMYDHQQSYIQRSRYQNSRYWTFINKVANIIDDGVQSGLFHPFDSTKVAAIFIESNIAVVMQRLSSKSSGNIEEDVKLITDILVHGIGAK